MRKNPYKIILTLLVLVMAVSLFVACGTPPPQDEEKITLSQSSLSIVEGGSASLTAIVTPDSADKTVTWASSDTTVATVTNGTVRGIWTTTP